MWDLSCPDWETRIREGRPIIPDLQLYQESADRAVSYFNKLRLPDVTDNPPMLEASGEWFRCIVRALFGSLVPMTNERMIREVLALVPKKSSKTTYGAAVMLTALLMNTRPRAEFLLVGPTQAISDRAYSQAVGMIEADDKYERLTTGQEGYLKRRFHIRAHVKEIVDRKTKAVLKVRTFDENILTGSLPTGALIDELHLLGKCSYAMSVIGQLRGGLLPIPEAFLFFITTQSDEAPAGAFATELIKARMIRDGKLTGIPMLPVLYEFPEDIHTDESKWKNFKNWWMVTPNNGKSITVERLLPDYKAATVAGEAEVKRWASQHLNIEIGVGLKSNTWVGAAFWAQNERPLLSLEAFLELCEVVCAGIDGGGMDDLLGLSLLGRNKYTGKWMHWGHGWAHKKVLEIRQEIAPRLLDFVADGDLTLVETVGEDVNELAEIVARVEEMGLLPEENAIAVDPMGVAAIVQALSAKEIAKERIVGIPQGYKLNGAIAMAERQLAGDALLHGGRRIMAWQLGNARAIAKGNATVITKEMAGKAKIDLLAAMLNSVAIMSLNPEAKGQASARVRMV
jgi:phage terminase large subunit-like protein